MKFLVTMKCPDALEEAISDAGASPSQTDTAMKVCEKWFEYGEYLTVEVDTEAKTCIVVEQ